MIVKYRFLIFTVGGEGNGVYHASEDAIEMKDLTITSRRLHIVCNILLVNLVMYYIFQYVQTIFKDVKYVNTINIGIIWNHLLSIYYDFLELAMNNQIAFPLAHQTCVVEDALQYEDNQTNTEVYQQCILQVNSVCEDTIVTFGKSISNINSFFDFIDKVLNDLNDLIDTDVI